MKHQARKRFGQNFLHDPGTIQKIIHAIDPSPGEHIVEIGPGMGAITKHLLKALGTLDVIEIDRDLIPILEGELAELGELNISNVDALKFDFSTLIKDEEKICIVGNLPYNISTPLLFHLFGFRDIIEDMHFMLQKEVVDRLTAQPGSGDYGRLSVMAQYHCETEKLFIVGPGAFSPQPKVDSAIVQLFPRHKIDVEDKDYTRFRELVRKCFTQRRKTLRNNLRNILSVEQIESLGIDPSTRAETLSVNQFVELANLACD